MHNGWLNPPGTKGGQSPERVIVAALLALDGKQRVKNSWNTAEMIQLNCVVGECGVV